MLNEHYETKYRHESAANSIPIINAERYPINRHESIVKVFPRIFREGSVLEFGAGDGRVTKTLLQAYDSISLYKATDLSRTRINGLRRGITDPRLQAVQGDVNTIASRENAQYDLVIMIALVEHLINPMEEVSAVRKLLRPGGVLYVDTPNMAKMTRRLKLLLGRFPSTASTDEGLRTYSGGPVDLLDEGHLHYFTYRSLARMLVDRCGFRSVRRYCYGAAPHPFGRPIHYFLANAFPTLFSDVVLVATA